MFYFVFLNELRKQFPYWYSYVFQILSVALTLLFYWFLSKSISFNEGMGLSGEVDYFSFVVTGELSLFLPVLIVSTLPKCIKSLYLNHTLENFLAAPANFVRFLLHIISSRALIELFKYIIYIGILFLIVPPSFGLKNVFQLFFLQFLYAPIFLAAGLIAASIVIFLGRGEKIVQLGINGLFVLAGVYFPLDVLPEFIQSGLEYLPFYLLLQDSRHLLFGLEAFSQTSIHFLFFALGLVLLVLSGMVFKKISSGRDKPIFHKPLIFN